MLAVQHECIPQAILGMDILCQAKSGMGKTAVFVLSVLQQIETSDKEEDATVKAIVLCHTRELAFQVHPALQAQHAPLPLSMAASAPHNLKSGSSRTVLAPNGRQRALSPEALI